MHRILTRSCQSADHDLLPISYALAIKMSLTTWLQKPIFPQLFGATAGRVGRLVGSIALGILLGLLALAAPINLGAGLFDDDVAGVSFAIAGAVYIFVLYRTWADSCPPRGRIVLQALAATAVIWLITPAFVVNFPVWSARLRDTLAVAGFSIAGAVTVAVWLTLWAILARRSLYDRHGMIRVDCPKCGYSMVGLHETRCPDCGYQCTIDELIASQHHKSADHRDTT